MASLCVGCAGVKVGTVSPEDYISQRRGDVLTTGKLSASARDVLTSLAISPERCRENVSDCAQLLTRSDVIGMERQLATAAELWLQEAMRQERQGVTGHQRFEGLLGVQPRYV